jgi:phosphoribulokinase
MSARHPIIAVTGSSGAGTTTVKTTFEWIFRREKIDAAIVEGDAFHRYDRAAMREKMKEAEATGNRNFSHFGPESNLFGELEELFRSYALGGIGRSRAYVHDEQEAAIHGVPPGTFTPWKEIGEGSDLLFYEGLHGAVQTPEHDVARHVDLLVGVAPSINLE